MRTIVDGVDLYRTRLNMRDDDLNWWSPVALYYKLGRLDQVIEEFERLRDHYPDLYLEWHGTSADEQLSLLEEHRERLTALMMARQQPRIGEDDGTRHDG